MTHTRRRLLRSGLAALAAPAVARAQPLAGTVVLVGCPGIFQDNYQHTLVTSFEDAHPGVQVTYVPSGTSAAIFGLVRDVEGRSDPLVATLSVILIVATLVIVVLVDRLVGLTRAIGA